MNGANVGVCYTRGNSGFGAFNIPQNSDGSSALTGEGPGPDDAKRFTIAEIEVFQLWD